MNKEKFWVEGSMSKEDMGDTISLIMNKLNLTPEQLSEDIGLKAMIINSAVKGKGNHVYNVLNKLCEAHGFKSKMTITEK